MNQVFFGQIQGFLEALMSINESSGRLEMVDFSFEHVPRTGTLLFILINHTQAWIRKARKQWHGEPILHELTNWEKHLSETLTTMFYFLRQPCNVDTADAFMRLLLQFFESGEVKVWKLEWRTPEGETTHPWPALSTEDYVFEHQNEIFQLTLLYSH